nr:carbamate kinase [Actinomycetales bacterium]
MTGLVVVAVGGNALAADPSRDTMSDQLATVQDAALHVVELVESGWQVVLTHGNGPQIGAILRQNELSAETVPAMSLDFCGAATQGTIGYLFETALNNELRRRQLPATAVSVVTQVLVDPADPAFEAPSKPIGTFMEREEAVRAARILGWDVVEDSGRGYRRVVASPQPIAIVQREAVRTLLEQGFLVIAAGGGGIPMSETATGALVGVEAVIDKDHASAQLATDIGADTLLILTNVPQAATGFGGPQEHWLDELTPEDAEAHLAAGEFAEGSMKPKVQAALDFLTRGGRCAIITDLDSAPAALVGTAGTRIVRG